MTTRPSVTVIIPNYNYARSLELCVRSVQEQNFPRPEIIVVDDCSTDDSVSRAANLGVTVLTTPRNSGVSCARNLGAAHAAGEILFFLDSDVALRPGALQAAVDLLVANPSAGAVCGIYEPEPLIRDGVLQECRCLQAYFWRLSSVGTVSWLFSAMCAMRADVFRQIGPFNQRLRQTEEVDYGQRLSRHYDIILTPDVRGLHDDDHQLIPLIRKIFTRGRLRVPLYARRRKFAKGFETPSRAWASLFSILTVAALPIPLLLGPAAWAVAASLLAITLLCDMGMYRFVMACRGLRFLPAFIAVQLIFNVTVMAGIAAGSLQWLASRDFRGLYQQPSADAARLAHSGQPSAH